MPSLLKQSESSIQAVWAGAAVSRNPANASDNLNPLQAVDAVGRVPLARWDMDNVSNGSTSAVNPRFGAYLQHPEHFDAGTFSISVSEAQLVDPQQRLLLETVAEALPRTGSTRTDTNGLVTPGPQLRMGTGVYVGIASSDYSALVAAHTARGAFHATACAPSVACGRLSFAFGFGGPSVSVGAPLPKWSPSVSERIME